MAHELNLSMARCQEHLDAIKSCQICLAHKIHRNQYSDFCLCDRLFEYLKIKRYRAF
jgi:hypothetical protein